MSERFVAADASPLIGLATAGILHFLRDLYGTVTITRLVKDEITGHSHLPGAAEVEAAMRSGWLRVAPTPLDTWKYTHLDAGEASTLALAEQHGGALVLMDDALGREQAAALGLEVAGVTSVLVEAKRAGLVGSVRRMLERLARRGHTIADETVRVALAAAGEDQEPG